MKKLIYCLIAFVLLSACTNSPATSPAVPPPNFDPSSSQTDSDNSHGLPPFSFRLNSHKEFLEFKAKLVLPDSDFDSWINSHPRLPINGIDSKQKLSEQLSYIENAVVPVTDKLLPESMYRVLGEDALPVGISLREGCNLIFTIAQSEQSFAQRFEQEFNDNTLIFSDETNAYYFYTPSLEFDYRAYTLNVAGRFCDVLAWEYTSDEEFLQDMQQVSFKRYGDLEWKDFNQTTLQRQRVSRHHVKHSAVLNCLQ